jgi:hypothetical protein
VDHKRWKLRAFDLANGARKTLRSYLEEERQHIRTDYPKERQQWQYPASSDTNERQTQVCIVAAASLEGQIVQPPRLVAAPPTEHREEKDGSHRTSLP